MKMTTEKSIRIRFTQEAPEVTALYTADERSDWYADKGSMKADENYRSISKELSLPQECFFRPRQVLGTDVCIVREEMAGDGTVREPSVDADAVVTDVQDLALCLIQSDCAPVCFYDPVNKAVGLAHSGRQGTQGNIVSGVICVMRETYGTDPKDLLCVIGPHICGKCYEVGKETADEFASHFPESIRDTIVLCGNGRITLDLGAAILWELIDAGVQEERIRKMQECTFENREMFSFRRGDGLRSNLSLIMIRSSRNPSGILS